MHDEREREEEASLACALDAFLDDCARSAERDGTRDPFDGLGGLPAIDGDALRPGRRLGEFELVRLLGSGAMGRVFEARSCSGSESRVALKVMRAALLDADHRARFRREVAAVASLDHEGILPLVAADVSGEHPYYAMPFVEGLSGSELLAALRARRPRGERGPRLGEVLAASHGSPATEPSARSSSEAASSDSSASERVTRRRASRAPLAIVSTQPRPALDDWRLLAELGAQWAEALSHAHARGVLHRDVKPANVFVARGPRALLLDFGLAARSGDASLTRSGAFVGTPAYASPEQLRGEQLDERSDLWSLGALLYELASLRPAFEGGSEAELVRRIERDEPAALPTEVPPSFAAIVRRALEKRCADRYANAAELAADLRVFARGGRPNVRRPALWPRLARVARRHPLASVALALVLVLAARELRRFARVVVAERDGRARVAALATELEAWRTERDEWWRLERDRELGRGGDPAVAARARDALLEREVVLDDRLRRAGHELDGALERAGEEARLERVAAECARLELEFAFERAFDLTRPAEVRRIEATLARYDRSPVVARLLDRRGTFELLCDAAGARLRLRAADPGAGDGFASEPLFVGAVPENALTLPEGSYLAELEAPGHAPARLPFVVRRASLAAVVRGPEHEAQARLFAADEVGVDWVPVPAGWTLIDERPARWALVDTFLIARHEVRLDDYLAWMNEGLGAAAGPRISPDGPLDGIPRDGHGMGEWLVDYDREHERWTLAAGDDGRRPVRGLDLFDMYEYALEGGAAPAPLPAGWYRTMPTIAQWRRAARGADGRAFPWGEAFSADACLWLDVDREARVDPSPRAVGWAPRDRSPFGVHDLGGSLREATIEPIGGRRESWGVCGGSYRSATPGELRVDATSQDFDGPRWDVGFRLVIAPLPEWVRAPRGTPSAFADDFERADSPDVGRGWHELRALPGGLVGDPWAREHVSIENGELVCVGGIGHGSVDSLAVRSIAVDERGFDLSVTLSATAELEPRQRAIGLSLFTEFGRPHVEPTRLEVQDEGVVFLEHGPSRASASTTAADRDWSRPHRFELAWRPGRLQGRIIGQDGFASETLAVALPVDADPPRFLTLVGGNWCGLRLAVDDVELTPVGLARSGGEPVEAAARR